MLPKAFYEENRRRLLETLPENSVAVLFAGHAPRQSADAYYPFFANRNFLYRTGMEEEHLIYLAVKRGGTAEEAIYLQQEDPMQERWFGRRIHAADVPERYGFADCRYIESFEDDFDRLAVGIVLVHGEQSFDEGERHALPENVVLMFQLIGAVCGETFFAEHGVRLVEFKECAGGDSDHQFVFYSECHF